MVTLTLKQQDVYGKILGAGRRGLPSIELYSDERSAALALVKKGLVEKLTQGDNVRRGQRVYVTYRAAR